MSSATSIEEQGLRPWQFFLLAGMLSATGVVLVASGQSPASIIVLSLTVVSASFVALGAYRSLSPLVHPEIDVTPQLIVGHTRAALEREKTLVLRSIKELEFDYAMKKIAKSDFEEMSTKLRARAMGLMRQLDEGGNYREQIEREVSRRLSSAEGQAFKPAEGADSSAPEGPPFRPNPAVAVPEGQAFRPGAGKGACTCGTMNDPDARFCKNCGSKLVAA